MAGTFLNLWLSLVLTRPCLLAVICVPCTSVTVYGSGSWGGFFLVDFCRMSTLSPMEILCGLTLAGLSLYFFIFSLASLSLLLASSMSSLPSAGSCLRSGRMVLTFLPKRISAGMWPVVG